MLFALALPAQPIHDLSVNEESPNKTKIKNLAIVIKTQPPKDKSTKTRINRPVQRPKQPASSSLTKVNFGLKLTCTSHEINKN